MSITAYSGSLLSGLITSYLPIEDPNTKFTTGLLINETIQHIGNKLHGLDLMKWFKGKQNHIIISEYVSDNKYNPIYNKIEDFIIKRFLDKMSSCELIPKKGDYTFTIDSNNLANESFLEPYTDKQGKDHLIVIRHIRGSGNGTRENYNKILLESKTANLDILKEYCQALVTTLNQKTNEILRVHRTMIESKQGAEPYWDTLYVKTNKSKRNTILSQEIKKELFDDIEWFLNNEEWYANKGIPYKRGYILHGPPGCGKSSVIKSIASEYGLDIFNLELDSIKSNSQLTMVISEICYLAQHKKYILAIEDADKSKFFNRYHNNNSITTDCFINCLDGIVEAYGQITIITANNVEPLKEISALTRPGRIDKILSVTYCNKEQVEEMIKNFYDTNDTVDKNKLQLNELTPADLIKIMQKYPNDLSMVLKILYNELTDDSDKNNKKRKRRTPETILHDDKNSLKRLKMQLTSLKKRKNRDQRILTKTTKQLGNMISSKEKTIAQLETKIHKNQQRLAEKKKITKTLGSDEQKMS